MKSQLFKKSYVKMFSYLFIAGVLILSSCTSGKKAMERGNYYESVMLSVSRLQKNPTHKKSIETLRSAYPLSLQYYDDNIRNLKARDDRNKWRGIVDSYTNVNNMYEAIRRSPGALNVVNNPKNYYNELAQAKENAAEESYQFGITELNKQTVESGRIAYGAFKDTDSYVPGFKDVIAKMEEAYWMGTIKVLINPIPVTTSRVQLSANFFEDKIHEYLKTQPINEFTRFMTDADLQAMNLAPDQILQMQFDDFTIGQVSTVERQIDQTMDSVVVGSVNASSLVGGNTGTIRPTNTSVNNNTNVSNTNVNNTTSTNNTNTTNTTSNTNVNTSNTNNTTTSNTSVNTTNTNNTNTSNSTNVNNTTNTAVNTSSNTNVNNTTNTGNTGSNTNTATNSTN
ncbi:MAG: hypothetical protein OEW75_17195, partial [Cyclobacteriaceae bacterium]|nr:hypothetical protein [Cyclobacteriaceae bacterium]